MVGGNEKEREKASFITFLSGHIFVNFCIMVSRSVSPGGEMGGKYMEGREGKGMREHYCEFVEFNAICELACRLTRCVTI